MLKTVTLLISILLAGVIQAQTTAMEYYNAKYFKEASLRFEKTLAEEGQLENDELKKLADCYYQMNRVASSVKAYKEIYKENEQDTTALKRLVELMRMQCNYDAADKYLAQLNYSSMRNKRFRNDRILFPQNNSKKNKALTIKQINIPNIHQGMGYTFKENGDLIAGLQLENKEDQTTFTTLGTIDKGSSVQHIQPLPFEEETPFFNAYPSFCSQSNKIYFTANINSKKRSFREQKNVLQLFEMDITEGRASSTLLSFNQEAYNFTHPAISADGKRLYFVSDKPNGFGGFDVYYVQKTETGWSEIINCGKNVNTAYDEITPFVKNDSLFYSSYGHENHGGSDVFLSQINQNEFTEAKNLGFPINSCQDDFSFVLSPDISFGLLTSNRNYNDANQDDVFQIKFPAYDYFVKDTVSNLPIAAVDILINKKTATQTDTLGKWEKLIQNEQKLKITYDHPYYVTKTLSFNEKSTMIHKSLKQVQLQPVLISGRVIDDITGNEISDIEVQLLVKSEDGTWNFVEKKQTDLEGKWSFHVRKDKAYKVIFEKDDYIAHEEIIPEFDGPQEIREEVLSRMNPFSMKYEAKKDLVIQIDNIYFDFNSSYIREDSYPVLDKVKGFLDDNPDVKIELSAHTDCLGKDDYNLWLSDRRAKSSKNYLVKLGVSPNRIKAKGYGEQRMIVTDCELQKRDDNEAQKNRRVEVKVL
ncbi:hypothetical protein CW751_13700 [Brumimicrobium salinarum]|uniref:OmpA-like domain-containing protein n=1 Tax=Brumimicrobium salinarum TaxID=2058658 RepID=A0A2I0QZE7_9FLAO|nr:OmpA family protein [Brumimicrobium salinarum]PKR79689.1 hypothetical protein CW751_13700 [Brumimicrobium salinarum]